MNDMYQAYGQQQMADPRRQQFQQQIARQILGMAAPASTGLGQPGQGGQQQPSGQNKPIPMMENAGFATPQETSWRAMQMYNQMHAGGQGGQATPQPVSPPPQAVVPPQGPGMPMPQPGQSLQPPQTGMPPVGIGGPGGVGPMQMPIGLSQWRPPQQQYPALAGLGNMWAGS